LAGIVCLLALKVYGVWNNSQALPPTVGEGVRVKPHTSRHQAGNKIRRPSDTYNIIVEKNLFAKNRGYNEGTESLIPPSEITLYGTFVFGKYRVGLLKVQEKGQKGVRRRRANEVSPNQKPREVAVGDTIAGYRVTRILEDKVVLENETGKSYTVKLEISDKRSHVRTSISKARTRARAPKRKTPRRTTRSSHTQRR